VEVNVDQKGPQIILSRTHNGLIARLFEIEVPEVYDGLVRIMAIARDPGDRAKVAVIATDEGIDAVGTCVGVKGSRVQTVVRELEGEKIDLLPWNQDPALFIANALQPADVVRVNIDDENASAEVIVPDDQLSLAIGRRGQNARLAAKLTGWKIDIKSESEVDTQFKEEIAGELFKSVETDSSSSADESDPDETTDPFHPAELDLTELEGVGAKTAELLEDSGFSTVESIAQATLEELSSLPGIGSKTAEKIHHAASKILSS
jgi:N utilization substance protein A